MSDNTIRMVARGNNAVFTPVANNGGNTITGLSFSWTNTYTVGNAVFTQYVNGAQLYKFAQGSKILVKQARISIPNLPGARGSEEAGSNPTILIRNLPTPTGSPTTAFLIPAVILGDWVPLNLVVSSPKSDEAFTLDVNSTSIRLDNRNLQAVYSGVSLYLMVELDIIAPAGIGF